MSGIGGGMAHKELVRIDPNAPPRLNNDGAVGFDLEAGWATHQSNIHQKKDWFETVVQVAAVAVVSYFTAGAASGWAAAAGWGSTAAAVAGGVAAGAASAAVSGAMNGNLAFKDILRGALAGGLSGGLLAEFGGVAASYGPIGTVALRTTVQGGIQALLGGSFKDGAIAGFASGLAQLASASLESKIAQAVVNQSMSDAEVFAARTFSKVLGSAIRAAGSPGDPAQAMASAFLADVLEQADPAGFRPPVVTAPPAGPPPDPFAAAEAGLAPGQADDGWGQFDQRNPDIIPVGLVDEAKRSWEVFQGFAEGSGMSLLATGEALIDVAKNPAAFIAGMKGLLTSPEARAQFGADVLNKVQIDVRLLEDAFNAGDLRGTGQMLGKLVADAAQLAGGVEALARLGVSTTSAGGRMLVNATQVMTARVATIRSAFGGAQISDDVAMRIANNFGRDGDTFTQAAERMAAARNAGWRTPEGDLWWPPSNGAVPGTQLRTTLEPGMLLDRFGGTTPRSSFLSPVDVPIGQRALSPSADLAVRDQYVVLRPFSVEQSNVMPWFGQPGMGIQFDTAKGIGMTIAKLEERGFIKKVGP